MTRPSPPWPKARTAGLLVQHLADETVVYDLERHRGHCLNRAAALVWSACDGKRSPDRIARRVSRELETAVDADYVHFALRRLARARLLASEIQDTPAMSRRDLARRLGQIGAASLLLPSVISIVAPTAVQAATVTCTPLECIFGGSTRRGCCCDSNNRTCIQLGRLNFNYCGGDAC